MKPELDMPEVKIEFDMPEIKQELKISETKQKTETLESDIKLSIPEINQGFRPETNQEPEHHWIEYVITGGAWLFLIIMLIIVYIYDGGLVGFILMLMLAGSLAGMLSIACFAPPSESEIRKMQWQQYRNWYQQVTDVDIEHYVGKQCYRVTNDPYVEMKERIKREVGITTVKPQMIYLALMAQYAKIPICYAGKGIPSARMGRHAEAQEIEDEKKFMIWYDKELRAHGFPTPLLFVHFWNRKEVQKNINVAVPVADVPLPISRGDIPPITNVCGGFYFWEPEKVNINLIA